MANQRSLSEILRAVKASEYRREEKEQIDARAMFGQDEDIRELGAISSEMHIDHINSHTYDPKNYNTRNHRVNKKNSL